MRVALISDTHLPSLIRTPDELGPQLAAFLAGADLILHGGDVVRPFVLDWCEQFAPVVVAQGNNDDFTDPRMEKRQILDIEGWRIGMVHELRPEDRPVPVLLERALGGERVDVLIGGDTHVERLEYRDGVVVINSGSPTLPHHKEFRLGTVALLDLTPNRLHAEIISLGHTMGSPNPTVPRHLELHERRMVAHSLNGEMLPLPALFPEA
ncbi:MAG: metallophosphoesterase family protein [Chloroflexi bacterium]|nr:metallophosphoesterase family protein [Chloroflexota bacterium]